MVAFTVPLLVVLLVTSQCMYAYPSASSLNTRYNHPMNLRLKRDFGYLQHHELANNFNDYIPSNIDESLQYAYPINQRQNRKRLIDF
ncbi:unnamed protein product [Adineta steineri]|uniref:Uncharacterized protein n=1 Tax=Adineta steineri TaxID=433720 RepID=A0A813PBE9_9BILA|nr:unnamed protein product [Adineta steineri]CAF1240043.1 unnamed protein product [Adineta steineri]CAF1299721.1 unnamed protein product [Adineta steineri]CAF3672692.1 unnamed protein product [Adineta steineri]CAF3734156.1 unnamed protein product [Adineta steineri]